MTVRFDVETYSALDLKKVGLYRYARDPSTDVLCAAWQWRNLANGKLESGLWRPGMHPPVRLFDYISDGHDIEAHNCAFDAEIWRFILAERYGWIWPGYEQWTCSMAKAQITNLPGKLELAARFFGTTEKDMAGHRLMMNLCKPARVTKNLKDVKRHHTPEKLDALAKYCKQDVAAEAGFSVLVPKLSSFEQQVWEATWRMNRRGVRVDVPLVLRCQEVAEQVQTRYRAKLAKATRGDVETEGQKERLAKFLIEHGVNMPMTEKGNPSFAKETKHLIDMSGADDAAIEAFGLYEILNKSSLAKLAKMQACLCPDGRIRGMVCYAGAGQTGRWAGREVQLQNLPRGIIEGEANYQLCRDIIMDGADVDELEFYYGNAMDAVASMIRACLVPNPGNVFVCADYSAIEGRVLAYEAGEDTILEAYRRNMRMYAVAASLIFRVPYEQVIAEKKAGNSAKDKVGKVADLACGYQGGIGAFKKMGGRKLGLSEERMQEIVDLWRANRPGTVQLWRDMNDAAIDAVCNPMKRVDCRMFRFGYNGDHLKMRLPSRRMLWYRRARLGEKVWPDGGTSKQVEYYGMDDNKRLGWQNTYGGKLVENATQAVARDILADATIRAEQEGWPLVMTVHDELVAEVPEGGRDHDSLCSLMRQTPAWAAKIPTDAAGWTGKFYRKD